MLYDYFKNENDLFLLFSFIISLQDKQSISNKSDSPEPD